MLWEAAGFGPAASPLVAVPIAQIVESLTMMLLIAAAAIGLAAAAPQDGTSPAPTAPFATAVPLSEGGLAAATAREDVNQLAINRQTASVSSSSVSGTTQTGNASFAGNAFSNVSGLTVINANTGNNVAINGAITVNLTITPAAPQ